MLSATAPWIGRRRQNEPRRILGNASQTRADILSAARRRFGAEGYERTTLRAVAADVGVDAALVIRYFGSKQDLFGAAVDFAIELPDLSSFDPDEVSGILLPRFFAVWEDETFVARFCEPR